jgi:hypothetical protein
MAHKKMGGRGKPGLRIRGDKGPEKRVTKKMGKSGRI